MRLQIRGERESFHACFLLEIFFSCSYEILWHIKCCYVPTNLFRMSLFVMFVALVPLTALTLDISKAVVNKIATCLAVLLRNLVNVYKHFEKLYCLNIRSKLLPWKKDMLVLSLSWSHTYFPLCYYIVHSCWYNHILISCFMQDEFTVWGVIIVPSRGWKSLNIWEQL